MTADAIPYQLRPNKFIDRQMFIDLLSRIMPDVGNEKYIYASMGGKHLVDQVAIYRQLGVPNLVSIDGSQQTVARQMFNRPNDKAQCLEMYSGSLPANIDTIFGEFPRATNIVIWLDYTDPHARLSQFQESTEILKRLKANDILRITLNANLGTLEKHDRDWKSEGYGHPNDFRLERLREELGDFVPKNLEPFGDNAFPIVLAKCMEIAIARAENEAEGLRFQPVLLTTYRDGQRMVTITVRAVETPDAEKRPLGLKSWKFTAKGWDKIIWIEAPDLSIREKQKIDQYLNKSPSYILKRLNFYPASNHGKSIDAIKSYKLLHRYYPEFRNVEA